MKTLTLIMGLLFISLSALADDASNGCGLGWQVNSRNSFFGTTTRGTTNSVLPNTFSMTSGTSGCAKHPFAMKKPTAAVYAEVNQDSLLIEMAQGKGEYLEGFAKAFGCSDKAAAKFASMTQANYQTVTSGVTSGIEMAERVYNQMQKVNGLSAQCGS